MIFNGEMVRAILDGRKTQTRRIMKNQPAGDYPDTPALIRSVDGGFQWYGHYGESSIFNCPFGAVGDRIWVRETFSPVPDHEEPAGCSAILYAADGNGPYGKWVPSIHMPRWASRITLEITGVRVERLNSISDSDASKEGCCIADMESGDCLSDVFARLWTSIYGNESWKVNPWVWVIEFKVVPNVQDNPA
ncbi:morphogenetic protein [Enterobacter hormaechei]|nr:morphogenetic protein [Enterobacter hormaechei]